MMPSTKDYRLRGLETVGSHWSLLDLTAFARMEAWEDSPTGWPQTPAYEWWERHDENEHSIAQGGGNRGRD